MPLRSVYIRKEDLELWETLDDKSEKVSRMLNSGLVKKTHPKVSEPFVPQKPDELGYPCCRLSKPCRHWAFDGVTSVWTNELTGKTREVM